ncbi:bifunctional hydroxymethylpyrimidine kinase/phosphomethylpyrimidine kinase [Actinomycetospora termitidis]|uniref:Bifunctional hydroxymethylpyrimidine kinase/phosphomethylpyrimidine kinase n=1 Tax=Actinomycetospora termitidis TaxID=3053470 RepID=A0ABT7MA80_9PSEU|nr:bifunctional hydroxymethylpyrimidine kinase/phosphomethylpyrimidine kinase [Actinomycetospora sp. Odt1-22]MDL5157566.1 bifunctional hydroxymethylpyrimidine kinase/phosphomethylpyrimidine kinase [Actinomycetospora sp. Odt1-22]
MADTPPRALTIGGSDSGGAAGIEADLRAMTACGVHGCVAMTAVTVQNSLGVSDVHLVPPETVAAQVRAVVTDIGVGAAKTGMLATAGIIAAVADVVDEVGIGRSGTPFVLDPVAASMYGEPLLAEDAMEAIRTLLFPRAALATPNLDEIRLLAGVTVTDRDTARKAADALHDLGARWALVKGGHLHGSPEVVDLLSDGTDTWEFTGPRIDTPHVHGAGDALASATCAGLARGLGMPDAVAYAERYIRRAVAASYPLGAGTGPVSPLWAIADWDG